MAHDRSFSDQLDDDVDRWGRMIDLLSVLIVDAARRGDGAAVDGGLDVIQRELDKLIAGAN